MPVVIAVNVDEKDPGIMKQIVFGKMIKGHFIKQGILHLGDVRG